MLDELVVALYDIAKTRLGDSNDDHIITVELALGLALDMLPIAWTSDELEVLDIPRKAADV